MVFAHLDRYGHGERIMMPMGNDGATGDGIFGATEYESIFGEPAAHHAEVETWFSLQVRRTAHGIAVSVPCEN